MEVFAYSKARNPCREDFRSRLFCCPLRKYFYFSCRKVVFWKRKNQIKIFYFFSPEDMRTVTTFTHLFLRHTIYVCTSTVGCSRNFKSPDFRGNCHICRVWNINQCQVKFNFIRIRDFTLF